MLSAAAYLIQDLSTSENRAKTKSSSAEAVLSVILLKSWVFASRIEIQISELGAQGCSALNREHLEYGFTTACGLIKMTARSVNSKYGKRARILNLILFPNLGCG